VSADALKFEETLNRISSVLGSERELDKLVQLLTDEATALCGAEFGAFFYNVTDAGGESYMLYTISGVPREAFSQFPMPRNTAVFAPTFSGEAVFTNAEMKSLTNFSKVEFAKAPVDLPRFRGELRAWDQSSCWGVILSSSFVAFFGSAPRGAILPSRPAYSAAVARSGGQGRPILGPPGGRVLDGREHDGRLVCVGSDLQTLIPALIVDR